MISEDDGGPKLQRRSRRDDFNNLAQAAERASSELPINCFYNVVQSFEERFLHIDIIT